MSQRKIIFLTLFVCTLGLGLVVWREMDAGLIKKQVLVHASVSVIASSSPNSTIQSSASVASVRVPIFIYHSVYPDFGGETRVQKGFSVTPEIFEKQLAYLANNGYTAISLDDLERYIKLGTTTVARPVMLTFDDGWKNEYTYAFPLLKKYNMTATFFIYTNPIGKDKRFMTWEDVQEMDAAGMSIQGHSLSHPYLTKMPIDQERREVVESKKKLEEKLGKKVTHFASPFGQTDERLVSLLKEAGYSTGRTTVWGATHSERDLMSLSGFLVERDMRQFIWVLEKAK